MASPALALDCRREVRNATVETAPTEIFLSDGRPIYVRHLRSSPQGKTIVIVHGLMSESVRYEPLARKLQEEGYNVVLIDLLNHGRTLARTRSLGFSVKAATFHQQAQAIAQVLVQLKVENPLIYAHSYGGGVAAALTRLLPVAGLFLDKSWISPVDEYYREVNHQLVMGVARVNPWAGAVWSFGLSISTQFLMPKNLQEVLERGYDQSEQLRSPHLSKSHQVQGATQSYDPTPFTDLLSPQFPGFLRWRASHEDQVAPRKLIEQTHQQLQSQGYDSRVVSDSKEGHLAVMNTPDVIAQWILREISQLPQ